MPGGNRLRWAYVCILFSILLLGIIVVFPLLEGSARADDPTGWVPQEPGTELGLWSVSAVDTDTAWAVGGSTPGIGPSEGVIIKTTDGGTNWITQAEGPADTPRRVFAVDENTAWVITAEYIIKTTDGGASWFFVYMDDPLEEGAYAFLDIYAVDTSVAWAVGAYMKSGFPPMMAGAILKTTDGGANWVVQYRADVDPPYPFPYVVSVMSVSAIDGNTAWVTGIYGEHAIIAKTTDGGTTWVQQHTVDGYHMFSDIVAVDADTAWTVGGYFSGTGPSEGSILKTTDGGTTWVNQYSGSEFLYGVSTVDTNVAWVVGNKLSGGVPVESAILKTADGGATWVKQYSSTADIFGGVSAVDACTAWAVGSEIVDGMPGEGIILKTCDGGDEKPDIRSISSSSAPIGAEVSIAGCDFGDNGASSYVSFGDVQAMEYTSWSDEEIMVRVPGGIEGEVVVTVTTPDGISNPKSFTVLAVISITPNQAYQHTIFFDITDLSGTGFQPGAQVRLEKDGYAIYAYNVNVVSSTQIACSISFFGVETGDYDVVVVNPDGQEARLEDGFSVIPACGAGGGAAVIVLGIMLGFISAASSFSLRKRIRWKRRKIIKE